MEKELEQAAKDEISRFRRDFHAKYGIKVVVTVPSGDLGMPRLSLDCLERIANKYTPGTFTIRTRRRFSEIVIPRQIFYKFALDLGYGCYQTGEFIGYDHATVLHHRDEVEEKLLTKDKKVCRIYDFMLKDIQGELDDAGLVFTDSKQGADSKSGVPPEFHEGKTTASAD